MSRYAVQSREPGPIRVLHLRDSPWVDGPGRTILETGSHIDPARVEYHIGALVAEDQAAHPLLEAARSRGLRVHRIPDRRGISREQIESIVELIRRERIDILHTSEFRSNVMAVLCRRRQPVRIATTVHGWIANDARGRVFRFVDKCLLRSFDAVIPVSNATRSLVPGWWLGSATTRVIWNALPLGTYGGQPKRAGGWRDVSEGGVLLNVGRLSPEKGQDLLLRAVAPLCAEFPRLRVRFAGIGPSENALRTLAADLGIADRVEFLSFVTDMPGLYCDADLVVQSSYTEGMPNVVLEAAWLGVPILATNVGGTAEITPQDASARLIEPHDPLALHHEVREFFRRPEVYRVRCVAAKSRIEEHFSFDARTRKLMDLYTDMMAANK